MLYRLAIFFLSIGLKIVARFGNTKAKAGIQGRKETFSYLKNQKVAQSNPIWMHVSSLGEFEQGLPILEALKQQNPAIKILVSFFSPSGYTKCAKHPLLDYVCYLPFDTPFNARKFLKLSNPQMAIFVKYDLWHFFLKQTQTNQIPLFLVSANFRKEQWFFKTFGHFFRQMLFRFDHIFTQNKTSVDLLKQIGYNKTTVCGDTRIDRVFDIRNTSIEFPKIEHFLEQKKAIIFGSSWPEDEKVFKEFISKHPEEKFIIAPHDISDKHIRFLKKMFPNAALYSESNHESNILIINSIGLLSRLYKYGKIAYIGGGLNGDIHNTLEPIVFGLPVVFGPGYKKFEEACWLVKNGGGFVITNSSSCFQTMSNLLNEAFLKQAGKQAFLYIQKNKGATEKIINYWIVNNYIS